MNIARRYMRNPEKIRVNMQDVVIPKIKQIFYEVREPDKINALSRLLDVEDMQLTIIFCHTKRDVDEVSLKLGQMGYNAGALHGIIPRHRGMRLWANSRQACSTFLLQLTWPHGVLISRT